MFSLNPIVQLPESVSVSLEHTKAQHRRDGEEGGAATKDGAEQSAREQNCGKGLRRHTDWHAYLDPLIHTVGYTVHAER